MIKYFGVMKRKSGLTREQFLQHWKEIHAPLALAGNVPRFRRYVQNHPLEVPGLEALGTDIDGITEFWFDDVASLQAYFQWLRFSDEGRDVREDTKLFVNGKEGFRFFAEEHVLKE